VSVINDSLPGDELVCVEAFQTWPRCADPRTALRRLLKVGERVRYREFYQDDRLRENAAGWKIVFRCDDDETEYHASQTGFVTLDTWAELERFFTSGVREGAVAGNPR
jgi:hypothetical protein